jgi:hypothetical protein
MLACVFMSGPRRCGWEHWESTMCHAEKGPKVSSTFAVLVTDKCTCGQPD